MRILQIIKISLMRPITERRYPVVQSIGNGSSGAKHIQTIDASAFFREEPRDFGVKRYFGSYDYGHQITVIGYHTYLRLLQIRKKLLIF